MNLSTMKSSSGSLSGLCMWGLIWSKYNWYRFVYKCSVYPVSTSLSVLLPVAYLRSPQNTRRGRVQ